jgi:hypothetical protein
MERPLTAASQESAQILLTRLRKTVERLEVISGPTSRLSWPDAVKARLVLEAFEPSPHLSPTPERATRPLG